MRNESNAVLGRRTAFLHSFDVLKKKAALRRRIMLSLSNASKKNAMSLEQMQPEESQRNARIQYNTMW
jgi:hypothetical protein